MPLAVETGVAGLSIEDSTGDPAQPLFAPDEAVGRMRAARQAIDRNGGDTLLVGRAEGFLCGRPDIEETIARLQAYAQAGADCLYAPGLNTRKQIVAVVKAVAPKPVNLPIGSIASGLTVRDAAELGVRRISVGGALARSAWGGFMRAAKLIAEEGRFDAFDEAASGMAINKFFLRPLHHTLQARGDGGGVFLHDLCSVAQHIVGHHVGEGCWLVTCTFQRVNHVAYGLQQQGPQLLAWLKTIAGRVQCANT